VAKQYLAGRRPGNRTQYLARLASSIQLFAPAPSAAAAGVVAVAEMAAYPGEAYSESSMANEKYQCINGQ